jgi:hypothetical protein
LAGLAVGQYQPAALEVDPFPPKRQDLRKAPREDQKSDRDDVLQTRRKAKEPVALVPTRYLKSLKGLGDNP